MIGSMRALGLDLGHRRIGIAISDSDGLVSTPYTTLLANKQQNDIAAILDIASKEEVDLIILGLPISLDGGIGPQAQLTLDFCDLLRSATDIPIKTWDERYSTLEAKVYLRDAGFTPSRARARVDAAAATILLQSYLDSVRGS